MTPAKPRRAALVEPRVMPARRLALALLLLLAAASVAGAAASARLPGAAELRRTVERLTAPELAGRRSGTAGGDRAAREIAGWLTEAGIRPAGDGGGYLQSFVLERVPTPAPGSLLSAAAHAFTLGQDWVPHGGARSAEVAGDVVFVGHGVGTDGWDDYGGLDVRGRIVLALDGAPPHVGPAGASRLEKLILARERGATGVLLVAHPLPAARATGAPVDLVSAAVTPATADALLARAGRSVAGLADRIARTRVPAPLATGVRALLRVEFTPSDVTAANVVGILPGTDPARADEAVVLGAHYDHLGVIGGALHPGADDNGSGTAVVLGLARAFAAGGGVPRTLVFAFFGAEELGLVGSGHYVRHPAWPLAKTVAMLNLDMVGRLREGGLRVGGLDSGSGLRRIVEDALHAESLRAELQGSPFSSSDHTRFYGAGVPVLFFFTGLHADYHRPGDTADKVDADGMARIAAAAVRMVDRLATAPRPAYVALPARPPRSGPSPPVAASAFLGVGADLRRGWDGVPLSHVVPGSAAERAGLREGDVLVRVGEAALTSFDDLRAALGRGRPGEQVVILYLRDGQARRATAVLDSRP